MHSGTIRINSSSISNYAAIQKKVFGSGTTALIISNEEMKGIMKIVESHEESGVLIKDVGEAIKAEVKDQKSGFFGTLLGALAANLFGNMLAGKGVIRSVTELLELGKEWLEQIRIFNAVSSFK